MQNNIAITGATGLLGSNLANKLHSQDYNVYVLVKDEESNSILNSKINRIYGNINSKQDVDYFILKTKPQHFIHLAAQTQAYDSLKFPYVTLYDNIVGTLNILESLREYSGCNSILVASSDKAYGELKDNKYTESHPLNGIYPYDASKSATDLISNSFRQSYKMPIVTTRACNIYGIGDFNKQRLIPGIVHSFKTNTEFIIRNQGLDIREYIHVDDVVDAYLALMQITEHTDQNAFNISSGDAYNTLEVFHLIEKTLGKKIKHKIATETTFEIRKQFTDSTLILEKTPWKPQKNLKNTIQEIVEWYLNVN
jgi:CDP-glucose 4,6-dehydratase